MCEFVRFEIPEGHFTKSAFAGSDLSGESVGDIVSGEHSADCSFHGVWFVLGDPGDFGSSEVSGMVEKVAGAVIGADNGGKRVSVSYGSAVAPDDGGTDGFFMLIEKDKAVHLVSDADGFDLVKMGFYGGMGEGGDGVFPPEFGVLFGPARMGGGDWDFAELRRGGLSKGVACFGVDNGDFY